MWQNRGVWGFGHYLVGWSAVAELIGVDEAAAAVIGWGLVARGVDGVELFFDSFGSLDSLLDSLGSLLDSLGSLLESLDSLLPSLDSLLDSFDSLLDSFPSFGVDFLGPRFLGGGAFDMQPWQYHLPRGIFTIGGM